MPLNVVVSCRRGWLRVPVPMMFVRYWTCVAWFRLLVGGASLGFALSLALVSCGLRSFLRGLSPSGRRYCSTFHLVFLCIYLLSTHPYVGRRRASRRESLAGPDARPCPALDRADLGLLCAPCVGLGFLVWLALRCLYLYYLGITSSTRGMPNLTALALNSHV
jgi:hypothetical protein